MLTEVDYGKFRVTVTVDTGPFAGKLEGSTEVTVRK